MCARWALQISLILGRIVDSHTCVSSSSKVSFSRFFFIFVSVENPCSQRYEVENGNRIVSAFIDISGYSLKTCIQNL